MSNWMPMERIYGTYSSWTHSPLDNDDSTTSKTSWKDTSRNLVGIRGLRRVLLALLLIIVFANRFPLRAHRGSAPLDNIDPEQFPEGVDWSQYAYCQYVTNPQYLCNSVMIFEALDRVGAKASKVMMFPSNWDIANDDDTGRLIRHAQARYNVQLSPNQVQHLSGETTWADSLTKGIVNLQKRNPLSLFKIFRITSPVDFVQAQFALRHCVPGGFYALLGASSGSGAHQRRSVTHIVS